MNKIFKAILASSIFFSSTVIFADRVSGVSPNVNNPQLAYYTQNYYWRGGGYYPSHYRGHYRHRYYYPGYRGYYGYHPRYSGYHYGGYYPGYYGRYYRHDYRGCRSFVVYRRFCGYYGCGLYPIVRTSC